MWFLGSWYCRLIHCAGGLVHWWRSPIWRREWNCRGSRCRGCQTAANSFLLKKTTHFRGDPNLSVSVISLFILFLPQNMFKHYQSQDWHKDHFFLEGLSRKSQQTRRNKFQETCGCPICSLTGCCVLGGATAQRLSGRSGGRNTWGTEGFSRSQNYFAGCWDGWMILWGG